MIPMELWTVDDCFDSELVKEAESSFPPINWNHWIAYGSTDQRKLACPYWHCFPPAIWKLMNRLLRIDVAAHAQADAGLWGSGINRMDRGDYVKPHLDASHHRITLQKRKFTGVLFLNSQWSDDWGGLLQFKGNSVTPKFNRLVIFENEDYARHWVTEVNCPENECRKTLSVFWYDKNPSATISRKKAVFD